MRYRHCNHREVDASIAVSLCVVIATSALLLGLAAAPSPALPRGPTPADKLSTADHEHHEVLRIDRDFGMPQWEIALDGWIPRAKDDHIEDVRLWWVNTDKADKRKPFSRYLRKFIEFGYERAPEGTLKIRLAGDRKAYAFTVSLAAGDPVVFANVERSDGVIVNNCRCESARLIARRVIGIPVGIGSLRVQCVDAEGKAHTGDVPYEALDGGPVYEAP